MLAFFVVGVADTIIAVLVGIFVYGVPFRGSAWVLALTTVIFLSGAFFWGILVSADRQIADTRLPDGLGHHVPAVVSVVGIPVRD